MAPTVQALLVSTALIATYYVSAQDYDLIKCDEPEICANITEAFTTSDGMECSNYVSCASSSFNATCTENECSLKCTESAACIQSDFRFDGLSKLECTAWWACRQSQFAIETPENGLTIECDGSFSCAGIYAEIYGILDELKCDGSAVCSSARIQTLALNEVNCNGYFSCWGFSVDVLYGSTTPLKVNCKGQEACFAMGLEYGVSDDEVAELGIESIKCEEVAACEFAEIIITNDASEEVVIEELACSGFLSCAGLQIVAPNANVRIKKCVCDDDNEDGYACLCTQGLEICDEIDGVWNQAGTDMFPCSAFSS